MFSQRGPTHAGGNTIKSGRSTQKKKRPMPQAQDTHDPAKEHGEAEKGFFAVRFRQNASNHSVSDLSSPESLQIESQEKICRKAKKGMG